MIFVILLFCAPRGYAQEEVPINIRVQRVFVETGTRYQFYLPEGEFHGRIQRPFSYFSLTAEMDYELLRGDIGFGVGYTLSSQPWKPEIFFRDQLLFRPLNERTREWSRKKSLTVSAGRKLAEGRQVRVSLRYERQRSPYREDLRRLLSYDDYVLGLGLYLEGDRWGAQMTLEKALRWFGGNFGYLLLEARAWRESSTEWGLKYRVEGGWAGNITEGPSPRYYLGGWSSLVGYENDKFYGSKRVFLRNWFSQPILRGERGIGKVRFLGWRGIVGWDAGSVGPMADIRGYKVGMGVGLGFDIIYGKQIVPAALITAYPLRGRGAFRVHFKIGR
ncbi:MAG TPA: hypothetical protein EYP17_05190 [Candidatus Latescibacteria bacterium]|nr:hypothetical protein [Candidatus Latescibacterota bacterium]